MPGWESGATDVGDCPGSGWVLTARRRQKTAAWGTLRDWAHRYNAEGGVGGSPAGSTRGWSASAAQKEELAEMVRAGPGNRWVVAGGALIEDEPGASASPFVADQTIGKPSAFGVCRRARNPKSDPDAQEARRGRSSRRKLPARSKPLEIWFQDEARVGQQGTGSPVSAFGRGVREHAGCRAPARHAAPDTGATFSAKAVVRNALERQPAAGDHGTCRAR